MLEVPASMWQLPELLKEVDFISVGSNDLLQFLFAADRGTPSLYARYDLLSQPVLDLLEQLLIAARRRQGRCGVPVSLCGEAASRPLEALALVGLGFTTLVDAGSWHPSGEGVAGAGRSGGVSSGAGGDPPRRRRCGEPARADRHLGPRTRSTCLSRCSANS